MSTHPATSVTPDLARATWRAVEPVHTIGYFTPERTAVYADIGLDSPLLGYFAARSAAFGAVGAGPVTAAFYNFNPEAVASALPKAWTIAAPEAVLRARLRAIDLGLRAAVDPSVLFASEVAEAAEIARAAAEAAVPLGYGRPLFAAHAGLDWPTEPHLVLWHAQTLLREFRGDGHVAALLLSGLDPLEALVTHAGTGQVSVRGLLKTRVWSRESWDAAVQRLRERDIVSRADESTVTLTDKGRSQRAELEDRTDALSLAPYEAIGVDGCRHLIELTVPLVEAITAAGVLPGTRPKG